MSHRDCCRKIGDCCGACRRLSGLGFHCECRGCIRDHDGQSGCSSANLVIDGFILRRDSHSPISTRTMARPRSTEATGLNSFCVRTCDGRYFPTSSQDKQSAAEGSKNLCPSSEAKIFTGNSIDEASSKDGKPYSALPNAFRYRKELVPGCTCNGKDVIGLASIKIEDDKTLRRGDLVANKGGFESVSRAGNGQASFSAASDTVRNQFAKLPVIASE
jgi:hypothetical protein